MSYLRTQNEEYNKEDIMSLPDLHRDETTMCGVKWLLIDWRICPTASNLPSPFLSISLCSTVVQLERGRGGLQKMSSEG